MEEEMQGSCNKGTPCKAGRLIFETGIEKVASN